LARIVGDDETLSWLEFELRGYQYSDGTRGLLAKTGRLVEEGNGVYLQSLNNVEALAQSTSAQMTAMQTPNLSGDSISPTLQAHTKVTGQVV
jgi:hypothetical protein